VDIVLLVGGSTRMPMIKAAVETIFPEKVRIEDPDFAVAKGAALAAGIDYNERIRAFIEKQELNRSSAVTELESRLDSIDTIFTEDEVPKTAAEAKKMLIEVLGGTGESIKVVDKLSRAFGTSAMTGTRETVLDNIMFNGDKSPAEATESYIIPGAYAEQPQISLFVDPIYECTLERGSPPLILKDSNGNSVDAAPGLLLRKVGDLEIKIPPNTPGDTKLEYTFCARGDGIHVSAKNLNTGEIFEAFIKSEFTKTKEELAEDIQRFSTIKTKGD
jgi:hypothetical protein